MAAAASAERCVLVIDEFPYLAQSYPTFPSILQAAVDAHRDSSRLFLVLCGSSLSFMKEQLLDRNSPLYGRCTAQLELLPFDFFKARSFFPALDSVSAANIYGMVGGVPLCLLQFDESQDLVDNIGAVFLNPGLMLYEEPMNLLKQEVSKAAPYNAVIAASAPGWLAVSRMSFRSIWALPSRKFAKIGYGVSSRRGIWVSRLPTSGGGGATTRTRARRRRSISWRLTMTGRCSCASALRHAARVHAGGCHLRRR